MAVGFEGETYNLTTFFHSHAMKLTPDSSTKLSISGYGAGWIGVAGKPYAHAVCISPGAGLHAWEPSSFSDITLAHLESVCAPDTELLLLGTGSTLQRLPPPWMAQLAQRRIGVECMDTAAACRCYNFLIAEGRRLVACLLPA